MSAMRIEAEELAADISLAIRYHYGQDNAARQLMAIERLANGFEEMLTRERSDTPSADLVRELAKALRDIARDIPRC